MLTKSTEYAIRALIFVQLQTWEQKRPGIDEITKEIEAPRAYTAKILQRLSKHALLNSMKGRGGGFFLSNEQSNSTLFDVIRIIEGESYFHKCAFGLKHCSNDNPCPMHSKYKDIRTGFFNIVKNESIRSLAQQIQEGQAVLNRLMHN